MQTFNKLAQLEKLLLWKKSRKYYADKLGITEDEVSDLIEQLKNKEAIRNEAETASYIGALEEQIVEVNNDKGTLRSTIESDFDPKSDEELAKLHKIDLSKYKLSSYWSKLKSNGKFTSSVFATLRKPNDYTAEDFAKFLEGYSSTYEPREPFVSATPEDVCVEISMADFHLVKKTFEDSDSIEERKRVFLKTLNDLMWKVKSAFPQIDRIIFPIGNDFFHTDTYSNTTTNGTPQDVIADYATEYEHGFDLLVTAIMFMRSFCSRMDVILVQGNHDRTKSFYLAHALSKYFEKDRHITFDRAHSNIKYVQIGKTFIGYHHGNCKIEDLPLIFATSPDTSILFGISKYREIHTGDKHHYMAKEVKGVRIQQMPSLSGTDRWHSDNNFINNIRAAIANVYNVEKGKVAEIEERI